MTDDQETRHGSGQSEEGAGALSGGLLDGLPESGRGAGGAAPANPFRTSRSPAPPEADQPTGPEPAPEPPGEGESASADEARSTPEPPGTGEAVPDADTREHEAQPHAFTEAEREAVYRVIRELREVSTDFHSAPVDHRLITRVLEAAHRASGPEDERPWDFLLIDDLALRTRVRDLARTEREGYTHPGIDLGVHVSAGLDAEAVLQAPLSIAVTVDPERAFQEVAGRHSKQTEGPCSVAPAVESLWLAAREEGLGVGWVSFLDERALARTLELPPHLEVVAYLCVGHADDPPVSSKGYGGRHGPPGRAPASLLEETVAAVGTLDEEAAARAGERQGRMTKPPGSLGILEEVSVRLAGLAGQCPPPIPEPAAVAVFAGDHGVHAQGVTSWPQEVTAQMVHNFLSGGAVVNAFAEQVGAGVTVVDVGVAADLPTAPELSSRKVARGTADATQGPAMTRPQVLRALETGIETARDLVAAGHRCLVTGDMGIANTTSSAALVCAYTGADPEQATGVGTGVDEQTHRHKIEVVRRALAANPVDPSDPVGTLAGLGGLEHAALAGFVLGGAALRVPVLLDGVIAGSAALAAVALAPEAADACFAGHRSCEPGHALTLEHLGLRPLVDLEMRLGEGSGALLALPLLQASARVLHSVATFEDAGVSTAH